jgi:hypothetical protein
MPQFQPDTDRAISMAKSKLVDPIIAADVAAASAALRDTELRMADTLERMKRAEHRCLKSADLARKSQERIDATFERLARRAVNDLYREAAGGG